MRKRLGLYSYRHFFSIFSADRIKSEEELLKAKQQEAELLKCLTATVWTQLTQLLAT